MPLHQWAKEPRAIGAVGFEPTTSRVRAGRAAGLRYTPSVPLRRTALVGNPPVPPVYAAFRAARSSSAAMTRRLSVITIALCAHKKSRTILRIARLVELRFAACRLRDAQPPRTIRRIARLHRRKQPG